MGPQMMTTWGQRNTTTEQADKNKRSLYKNMLLLTPDQPALPARYYIILYHLYYIILYYIILYYIILYYIILYYIIIHYITLYYIIL